MHINFCVNLTKIISFHEGKVPLLSSTCSQCCLRSSPGTAKPCVGVVQQQQHVVVPPTLHDAHHPQWCQTRSWSHPDNNQQFPPHSVPIPLYCQTSSHDLPSLPVSQHATQRVTQYVTHLDGMYGDTIQSINVVPRHTHVLSHYYVTKW